MKNYFNPEISLFSLPIVRALLATTVATVAISSALIAIHARALPFDFSSEGFAKFAELFKVPATFVAIGLSLIGLCGANHRSEQAKRQMRLTYDQNTFSNHFKNMEEFDKYLSASDKYRSESVARIEKALNVPLRHRMDASLTYINEQERRTLYRRLYPASRSGNLHLSKQFIREIDSFIFNIYNSFFRLTKVDKTERSSLIRHIHDRIETFSTAHSILRNRNSGGNHVADELGKLTQAMEVSDFIYRAMESVDILVVALKFDIDYEPSPLVKWFEEFSPQDWPPMGLHLLEAFPTPSINELFPERPPIYQ